MQTLRDFADSVGHIVRYTREYTLLVISAISSLGSVFYDLDDVPRLLLDSIAIYKPNSNVISPGVSTHGWKHILNVAIRPILKNCPVECTTKFMPAFLPSLFDTLDILLCEKWSHIMTDNYSVTSPTDDDEMTEEILEENLTRQLTTVTVLILIDIIGQVGPNSKQKLNALQIKMRNIIFNDINMLASFLKLLNHLISFKDSKCSFNAILLMKSCLADVLIKDESVDQFFTVEVMKTLLTTLLSQNANRDSFYEGLYVFTVLFLTLCREYESTREYLRSISYGYDIDELYEKVRKVENFKNQRQLMIEYFDHVKSAGGASDDFADTHGTLERKRQERREANLKRVNEKLVQKHKDPSDLLDDPSTENGAFANLFGSN